MASEIRTRFAPSPTGFMHVGNLRTALFNALFAYQQKGLFYLRIEDTDAARSTQEFADSIQEDMAFMGLSFSGLPIYQSQRNEIYAQYYEQLIAQDLAYPCYCTELELTVARKTQVSAGIAPRYSGACRHLSAADIAKKEAAGIVPNLRLRVPEGQVIQFEDVVYGPKHFNTDDLGDFIIRKSDGGPTFMFCNAVDDALMGITHVLRGEDHLTNTPRQLLILRLLGLNPPQHYGHLPIILGMDGQPLSKRNGSESVRLFRERGFLPIAISNYLARIGHSYTEEGFKEMEGLIEGFQLTHIGRAPARYDGVQRDYWQKEAVARLSSSAFIRWAKLDQQNLTPTEESQWAELLQANVVLPEEVTQWQQCLGEQPPPYSEEAIAVLRQGIPVIEALAGAIANNLTGVDCLEAVKKGCTLKGKALFMPLRRVLTGREDGPELVKIFSCLSLSALKNRIAQVKQLIQ